MGRRWVPGQPGDVSAYNVAMQAYGWLLTTPGATLYYGDEYGEYGGADPVIGTCIEMKVCGRHGNTIV